MTVSENIYHSILFFKCYRKLGTFRQTSWPQAKITTLFRLLWKYFNRIVIKYILETSVLPRPAKSCYVIWSLVLKNNSLQENINMQETIFLSFLKMPEKQNISNINYLITDLRKMMLLEFLVFIQSELASEYGIISQISIYSWTQNCIF